MENKEFKIKIPEGYYIDEANSTFECIKFKPKKVTYEDVAREMFGGKYFYIDQWGNIDNINDNLHLNIQEANNAVSEKQLEKLLAINKLMTIAKYLNGDWKPDWNDEKERKFYIGIDEKDIYVNDTDANNESVCYFKCPVIAQQAIDILGKETILLAYSTDW